MSAHNVDMYAVTSTVVTSAEASITGFVQNCRALLELACKTDGLDVPEVASLLRRLAREVNVQCKVKLVIQPQQAVAAPAVVVVAAAPAAPVAVVAVAPAAAAAASATAVVAPTVAGVKRPRETPVAKPKAAAAPAVAAAAAATTPAKPAKKAVAAAAKDAKEPPKKKAKTEEVDAATAAKRAKWREDAKKRRAAEKKAKAEAKAKEDEKKKKEDTEKPKKKKREETSSSSSDDEHDDDDDNTDSDTSMAVSGSDEESEKSTPFDAVADKCNGVKGCANKATRRCTGCFDADICGNLECYMAHCGRDKCQTKQKSEDAQRRAINLCHAHGRALTHPTALTHPSNMSTEKCALCQRDAATTSCVMCTRKCLCKYSTCEVAHQEGNACRYLACFESIRDERLSNLNKAAADGTKKPKAAAAAAASSADALEDIKQRLSRGDNDMKQLDVITKLIASARQSVATAATEAPAAAKPPTPAAAAASTAASPTATSPVAAAAAAAVIVVDDK